MLPHLYQHPKVDFESILITIHFKEISAHEILGKIPFLVQKYSQIRTLQDHQAGVRWVMGNLHKIALGNISLSDLSKKIQNVL